LSNPKKTKAEKKELVVRIIAFALAMLMILSVAYMAISFIIDAAAEDAVADYGFASSGKDRVNGTYVAVALRWGSSAQISYDITSPYGFAVGEANVTRTARSFTPVYLLDENEIVVAADANLTVGFKTCSLATSAAKTDIGAYHVELSLATGEIWDSLEDFENMYLAAYDHVFPAYIDGKHTIRIGAFASYTEASNAAAALGAELEGFAVSVASPSSSGVTILNEDYDQILFDYSGGENCSGAVCARQASGQDRAYICNTLNSYLYDGVFYFRRYMSSDYNNLTMINLVSLRLYCEGVVPAEIYTSWPKEAIKAFAVAVNCFAVGGMNKRFSTYGCDFVASSVDENYGGRHNVNAAVIEACAEVEHMVLTYEGKEVVGGAYSSSQGGYAVDTQYVWGGITGPYICSQPTPWEDYSTISRGLWFKEVSATELAAQIKSYNSSLISSGATSIKSVSYETTGDTSYLYSLTFTDNKGKTTTVTKSSYINAMMGSYTYSANFVIGKGSVAYTYEKVLETKVINLNENYSGYLTVKTSDGLFSSAASLFSFLSNLGKSSSDESRSMYVMTAGGTAILASEQDIPITTLPDADGIYTYVSDYGDFLIVTKLQEISGVHKASSSTSFAIVGKGFGHGVGMSQYGVCHLAKAGATYDQILRAYYPGTEIQNVYDFWGQ